MMGTLQVFIINIFMHESKAIDIKGKREIEKTNKQIISKIVDGQKNWDSKKVWIMSHQQKQLI